MVKLTKAQRAVLSRMGSGEEVIRAGHPVKFSFWGRDPGGRGPTIATLSRLKKNGLISAEFSGINSLTFRITDRGRAALEEDAG